jgi:hypothetical protein
MATTDAGQGICRLTLGARCWSSAMDMATFMRQTHDVSVCRCYAVGVSASRCDRRGGASVDVPIDASVVAPSDLNPYWSASDARRTLRLKAMDVSVEPKMTLGAYWTASAATSDARSLSVGRICYERQTLDHGHGTRLMLILFLPFGVQIRTRGEQRRRQTPGPRPLARRQTRLSPPKIVQ